MTVNTSTDVYYDPYDVALNADPYPTFRRMRDEAPLYYNAKHDFYALSRYTDINRGLVDKRDVQFGSGHHPGADQSQYCNPGGHAHHGGPTDPRRAP